MFVVGENGIAAIGLLSLIVVSMFFMSYMADNELGTWAQPRYPFNVLTWQKENWYGHNVHCWFENGTVVWNNETDQHGLWVAIIMPLPLSPSVLSNLNNKDYVAVAYHGEPLKIGDVIKVRGHIERAEKDGRVVYYVDTDRVVKTNVLNINDPNFREVLEVIQYDREVQADMTVTVVIIMVAIVTVLMPSNYG